MWNIIKAQNYQIKRDNFTWYVIIFAGVLFCIPIFADDTLELSAYTGGAYFLQMRGMISILFVAINLLFVSRICGWDVNDKTMNYEILAGHSRREIFWGRAIPAVVWSVGVCYLLGLIPMSIITWINGWGDRVALADAAYSYLLLLFPLTRLSFEFILLTFLLRNCYLAMIIGWTLYAGSMIGVMIAKEMLDIVPTVQLAWINMQSLVDFSNGSLEYIGGEDVMVFWSPIDQTLVIRTIVVSLIVAGIAAFVAYRYFRKSDQ